VNAGAKEQDAALPADGVSDHVNDGLDLRVKRHDITRSG
jgi:hypothetical protein